MHPRRGIGAKRGQHRLEQGALSRVFAPAHGVGTAPQHQRKVIGQQVALGFHIEVGQGRARTQIVVVIEAEPQGAAQAHGIAQLVLPDVGHLVDEPVLSADVGGGKIGQAAVGRHRAVAGLERQVAAIEYAHLRIIDGRAEHAAGQRRLPCCQAPAGQSFYLGCRFAAARASSVMRAQSPAASASFGVSQEPPTQATFLQARKAGAVSSEMPPVGQKVMSGMGPAIALSMPTPPAGTAGNSFNCLKPASRAASTSDGVITPGSSGRPLLRAPSIRVAVRPGETPNTAPASRAAANSSAWVSVPTPTMAPSTALMARIAARPWAVRRVTSSTRMPPATRAFASGTAWAGSSMAMTGMTRAARMMSIRLEDAVMACWDMGLSR